MPQETRPVRTLEEALALLDEWMAAYLDLEGQCMRLDHAWRKQYDELDLERHRLQAIEYDLVLADATERLANAEAENPFGC